MARDSNDTFVVEFPLVVEDQTHWRLSKAIELERMIYNATLDTVLSMVNIFLKIHINKPNIMYSKS